MLKAHYITFSRQQLNYPSISNLMEILYTSKVKNKIEKNNQVKSS